MGRHFAHPHDEPMPAPKKADPLPDYPSNEDVELLCTHTGATAYEAQVALDANGGDIVDAMMALTPRTPPGQTAPQTGGGRRYEFRG